MSEEDELSRGVALMALGTAGGALLDHCLLHTADATHLSLNTRGNFALGTLLLSLIRGVMNHPEWAQSMLASASDIGDPLEQEALDALALDLIERLPQEGRS